MKEYYQTLDLPPDASAQQIKDRYRQLVRIFHPDRYPKVEDKAYAERKLKEINEAYEVLHGTSRRGLRLSVDTRPPNPVVSPQTIDFGAIVHGDRAYAQLQVDNVGGLAQSMNFHQPDGDDWLQIVKGERLNPSKPLPMAITLEAKTEMLPAGQVYESWLDIDMNGVHERVNLAVHVVDEPAPSQRLGWLVATAVTVILLIVLTQGKEWIGWNTAASALGLPNEPIEALSAEGDQTAVAMRAVPILMAPATLSADANGEGVLSVQVAVSVTDAGNKLPAVGPLFGISDSMSSGVGLDRNLAAVVASTVMTSTATERPTPFQEPTMTPSPSPSHTPSPSPTATPSPLPSSTPSPTLSSTPSPVPTRTATLRPSPTSTRTPLPSRTPSLTPTESPSPALTRTATPRPSPTATRTPSPTLTATPSLATAVAPTVSDGSTSGASVVVTVPQTFRINARARTSVESPSLALLPKGSTYPAIARTIDNAWTRIVLPDGRFAWVFTTSMVADINQIETLPVILILPDAVAPDVDSPGVDATEGDQQADNRSPASESGYDSAQSSGRPTDGGEAGATQRVHRVLPGEFLKQLAERYYGDADSWALIYEANEELIGDDPNILTPGTMLSIPGLAAE